MQLGKTKGNKPLWQVAAVLGAFAIFIGAINSFQFGFSAVAGIIIFGVASLLFACILLVCGIR